MNLLQPSSATNGRICNHIHLIEKLNREHQKSIQMLLKNRSEEIIFLNKDNQQLLRNEQNLLNQINLLKNKKTSRENDDDQQDDDPLDGGDQSNLNLALENEIKRLRDNEEFLINKIKSLEENETKLQNENKLLKNQLTNIETAQLYNSFHQAFKNNENAKKMLSRSTTDDPSENSDGMSNDESSNENANNTSKETMPLSMIKLTGKNNISSNNNEKSNSLPFNSDCFTLKENKPFSAHDFTNDNRIQNKRKYVFDLEPHEHLNDAIWRKFKNRIFDRNPLPKLHQEELDHLIDNSKTFTIKHFDHKTWLSSIRKTSSGYTVYRLCSNTKCKSKCKIQLNIRTQKANISFKKICNHRVSSVHDETMQTTSNQQSSLQADDSCSDWDDDSDSLNEKEDYFKEEYYCEEEEEEEILEGGEIGEAEDASNEHVKTILPVLNSLIPENSNCFFDLSSWRPFSKSIWESLDERHEKLYFNKMTQRQLIECEFVDELTDTLLLREYQRKSKFLSIKKRLIGVNPCYVVSRKCWLSRCISNWAIFVDVEKREAFVSSSGLCQHTAVNEQLRFDCKPNYFSISVWRELSNGKQRITSYHKDDISKTQSEFNKIINHSKNLIQEKLGIETFLTTGLWKNALGYCLYRRCALYKKEKCECKLGVYINIQKHFTSIRCGQLCKHRSNEIQKF